MVERGDEEQAYIFFMRFMSIMTKLNKIKKYRENKVCVVLATQLKLTVLEQGEWMVFAFWLCRQSIVE